MMTRLEILAHYKGERDLLRETGESYFIPSRREPRTAFHRRNGLTGQSPDHLGTVPAGTVQHSDGRAVLAGATGG